MSFLAPPVSPSSTPHQETEGVTHSCLSQVTVPWAEQDGRWKLYYDTNSYKMHTYRQDIFNSHPYQNNFKRYFLESKATNRIHHNLIMHKQTAQHSSGSRSPPPHFHVFPFRFVSLVPSAVLPLCTLFPLNLSDLLFPCVPLFQSSRLPPLNP